MSYAGTKSFLAGLERKLFPQSTESDMCDDTKPQYLRIVPPEHDGNGAMLANGTKVLTEDGTEISGVTKIIMTAEYNGIWEAVLHVYVRPPELMVKAEIIEHEPH